MSSIESILAETDAPSTASEVLDVRDLPPPEPLKLTLETITDADDDVVVVQVSDRVPRHLFPRLDERGYAHDTVERDDRVVTAIWTD